MDAVSEQRLSQVHPKLADLIRQLSDAINSPDPPVTLRVTQGLRSWNEQDAYYSQGRQDLATVNEKRAAVNLAPITEEQNVKPITQARPGFSWHNFGLAVDVVPIEMEGKPDWDITHPIWTKIVRTAESLGLYAGAEFRTFPDEPHFQLTGSLPVTPDDQTRQTFQAAGISGVWSESGL